MSENTVSSMPFATGASVSGKIVASASISAFVAAGFAATACTAASSLSGDASFVPTSVVTRTEPDFTVTLIKSGDGTPKRVAVRALYAGTSKLCTVVSTVA